MCCIVCLVSVRYLSLTLRTSSCFRWTTPLALDATWTKSSVASKRCSSPTRRVLLPRQTGLTITVRCLFGLLSIASQKIDGISHVTHSISHILQRTFRWPMVPARRISKGPSFCCPPCPRTKLIRATLATTPAMCPARFLICVSSKKTKWSKVSVG